MCIRKSVSTIGLALALMLIVGFYPVEQGQARSLQQGSRYFDETGHSVEGEFLTFFDTYGGLAIFGYPISESFLDRGVKVQYFQNARFEWHPANPDPYKVQLGLLGNDLNYVTPSVAPPQFTSQRRVYFKETGHIVSYAFLDYFKNHGGLIVFGYPISEMHYDADGRIVQYFQRMKLEWHADDRVAPVQVGNLGDIYFEAHKSRFPEEAFVPAGAARPNLSNPTMTPTVPSVTAIRAVVSVRYSVMSNQGNQEISVLVTDNTGAPLHNAQVGIRFMSSAGQLLGSKTGLLTNQNGFVRVAVPVSGGKSGQEVVVYADVAYNALRGSAQNAFLLWW